jgi:hypothetical protein
VKGHRRAYFARPLPADEKALVKTLDGRQKRQGSKHAHLRYGEISDLGQCCQDADQQTLQQRCECEQSQKDLNKHPCHRPPQGQRFRRISTLWAGSFASELPLSALERLFPWVFYS